MAGGIVPKSQPLDLMLIKIIKGYCRHFYDVHILDAPVKPDRNPSIPSCQLCAT